MRIVVTGREGQVVRSLIERHSDRHEVVPVGRPTLDLAGEPEAIMAALAAERPDVIVSAAAYTAVDKAESEADLAFAINAGGAGAVATAARQLAVPLIHLSTDYVFDGTKASPYTEQDPTSPTSVYGASKLAGEQDILGTYDNVAILRTAWVYSPFGANFVKTMLRLAGIQDEVRVVADQLGNPTSALDIADAIMAVASNLTDNSSNDLRGVFHMSGSGEASWAEFAQAIFDVAVAHDKPGARVQPIAAAEYPVAARRPANSRLDCRRLAQAHGVRLPLWKDSMKQVVERLGRSPS